MLVFKIGEVCRLMGVSRPTVLQASEELGIEPIRINGRGDRAFDGDQVKALNEFFSFKRDPSAKFHRFVSEELAAQSEEATYA